MHVNHYLLTHIRTAHGAVSHACPDCQQQFNRKDNINRHLLTHNRTVSPTEQSASTSGSQHKRKYIKDDGLPTPKRRKDDKCNWCGRNNPLA